MPLEAKSIGLYGINPFDNSVINTVSTLRTTILQIRDVLPTDTVGYSLLRYRYGYGYDTPQPSYGAFSISAASLPANRSLAAAQIFVGAKGTDRQ